jgi:hypothetical protein
VSLPDAPAAVTEVAGAAHAGEAWFAGGFDANGQPVMDVSIYDPASCAWRAGPPLPEPIHHSALVSTGEVLYLVGGYSGRGFGNPVAHVRRLAPGGESWLDEPPLPSPRAAGAAAWDGARLLYAGGVGPDGLAGTIYALEGDAWIEVGALPQPREHFAAASDGAGTTWFMGGRTGGLATNLGTVEVMRGDVVVPMGAPLTPRSGVAAFWTPATGPCLAGGEGPSGTFAEVECVTADGRVEVLPPLATARHGVGAAVLDEGVVVAFGGPQPGLFVSAAAELLELRR